MLQKHPTLTMRLLCKEIFWNSENPNRLFPSDLTRLKLTIPPWVLTSKKDLKLLKLLDFPVKLKLCCNEFLVLTKNQSWQCWPWLIIYYLSIQIFTVVANNSSNERIWSEACSFWAILRIVKSAYYDHFSTTDRFHLVYSFLKTEHMNTDLRYSILSDKRAR